MNKPYQMCTSCVMDTTDPEIEFDDAGVCNHCHGFRDVKSKGWFPNEEGQRRLEATLREIKKAGEGKPYDSILGLSGGVDSSYLAMKAKDWGLRPLVVHVDAGWNTELAVANIEKIIKYCGFDLYTHVVDWEEMKDLHLAYLQAGVPNQDVPQDHIFFSTLYDFASKNNIKFLLNGGNLATESIFPGSWLGSNMDAINLQAIHKRFGKIKLKSYKTTSFFDYYIKYPFIDGMKNFRPLNYIPYSKELAIAELESKIGWRRYERKHGESLFTKFFQNYYLPEKFGYDKRLPHLSSLIVSGQMTREQALLKLKEPLYEKSELETDLEYFCKKLGIQRDEFNRLMAAPKGSHTDFASWKKLQTILRLGQRAYMRITGKKLAMYS